MDARFAEALQDAGLEMREDYSGRGMMGETTAAVEADSFTDVLRAAVDVAGDVVKSPDCYEFNYDDFYKAMKKLRYDQMGRGLIFY